jgi:hypothetical protein
MTITAFRRAFVSQTLKSFVPRFPARLPPRHNLVE